MGLWKLPLKERRKHKKVVGVVPDLHFPYQAHGYLGFLERTFKERGVTDIVIIGDMLDNSTISHWGGNINNTLSAVTEFQEALKEVERLKEAFPYAVFIMGNHDLWIEKTASKGGLPKEFLKSFKDLLDLPDTWKLRKNYTIDGVRYEHGDRFNGISSYRRAAEINRMSTVIGHTHSNGAIHYTNNGEDTIFGMNVGALIDDNAIAFEYGSKNPRRAVLGCGVVYSRTHAEFIPK